MNYIEECLKEANKAYKKGEVPIGAIIIKNDKIISRAHNTRERSQNALHHAEISQSKSVIKVFTQGKYGNVLSFLDSIQTQPQLHIQTLQLYPNSTTQDLVLYVRAHLGAP